MYSEGCWEEKGVDVQMVMMMVMALDTTLLDNPHLGPSHFDHPRFGAKEWKTVNPVWCHKTYA